MEKCTGNTRRCQCMTCSHNRAEDAYNRAVEYAEWYEEVTD